MLIIEKAREADVPEILLLQREAYQSEAEIYNDYSIQPLTQTLEQAKQEFQNNMVLKAVLDGKIIGSVRAYEKDNTAYIGKLIVSPAHQNKGIGKQLLQAIENEFQGKRFELFTGSKSEKT
jgi:predicted N-acetyltransferase YhbS